jgi:hypothetical protein
VTRGSNFLGPLERFPRDLTAAIPKSFISEVRSAMQLPGNSDLPFQQDWHGLYLAALFETRPDRLGARIREAESALAQRAHELFLRNPPPSAELKAVDACLQALEALRFCYGLKRDDHTSA